MLTYGYRCELSFQSAAERRARLIQLAADNPSMNRDIARREDGDASIDCLRHY
jgi:hypothetical protein